MIASIRSRRTFVALRADGTRVRNGSVRMTFLPASSLGEADYPQLAFAIGRSFGNAVERNRARRRLKAAFGEVWGANNEAGLQKPEPGAFLLAGNRGLLTVGYHGILADITECFADLARRYATPGRP